MRPAIIKWLTFLISTVALMGFVIIYWKLLTTEWSRVNQPDKPLEYLASSLSGLVGGIVAAAFGQKLPNPAVDQSQLIKKLNSFGRFISPLEKNPPREILATVYVIVYLGMSIWAIIVWIGDNAPKLIDNLAVVSIGLIIAIVTSYLRTEA